MARTLIKLMPSAGAAALGLVLVGGRTPARPDDPAAQAPPELQGCWRLESVEVNGEVQDPLGGGRPWCVIKGDRLIYGGQEVARLTADPSTSPRVIDLKMRDPDRVYEGIYTVVKDTLKVCLNARPDAKDRPSGWVTKDERDRRLLVFTREKSPPESPTEGLPAFAGLQLRRDPDKNVIVVDAAVKGSPAAQAGLKPGDVVLAVGGTEARGLEATVNLIRQARPGGRLDFRLSRDGKELTAGVTVGVIPFPLAALLE